MTMQLTDDQLRTIVSKAIFDQLEGPKRDEMITKALTQIMTAEKDGYNYGRRQKSDLERAFQDALSNVSRQICEEWIQKRENRVRIEDVIRAAIERSMNDKLVDKISEAISQAFEVKQ